MSSRFSKRQTIIFIILLSLAFILPFTLFLVKQRQEVRKKAAGTEVLQLKLEPENVTKNHGDSINYTVKLTNTTSSPVQIRVVGVEFAVKPRIDDFEVSQINCGSSLSSKAFGDVFEGKIRLVCYKTPGSTGPSEPLTIPAAGQIGSTIDVGSFQIIIKPSATGVYRLSSREVDGGRNNIPQETTLVDLSNIGAEASITITGTPTTGTPTPTSTLTPTSTPTPTPLPGQVKFKFKVKFSAVENKKPDQIVRVKIGRGETIMQELEQVNLTANNQGIYESPLITLSSVVNPGENYYLLIKGPKHLQVRFCQNSGQVRPCTTGKITLNSGENLLDFTGYPLPGGDLPPQDGVVNAIDAVALVNCLNTPETQECLNKADLNFDGIINTMDINIMNNTIYTRWEDE